MTKNLVIFTSSFPYWTPTESSFIMPELDALRSKFDNIIIVPECASGTICNYAEALHGITVDDSMSRLPYSRHRLLKASHLLNPKVMSLTLSDLSTYSNINQLASGVSFNINAVCFAGCIKRLMKRHALRPDNTLFYTFWFDHITSALALLCNKLPLNIITRVHGVDLYDFRVTYRSAKLRDFTMSRLLKVYCASDTARRYLIERHPSHSAKIAMSRLGSPAILTDSPTPAGNGNDITFFSCSRIAAEKRVHLNYRLIRTLALSRPDMNFRWMHIGTGDKLASLLNEVTHQCPANLNVTIESDRIDNENVHQFYHDNRVDWFMLMSETEGGVPVSICEAMSHGVPVIAASSGAIPEIVDSSTGVLLSHDPDDNEFLTAINRFIGGRETVGTLRVNARERWRNSFNSQQLRDSFASEISQLLP